eukprot:c4553_g1_i1 orf=344-643(+)
MDILSLRMKSADLFRYACHWKTVPALYWPADGSFSRSVGNFCLLFGSLGNTVNVGRGEIPIGGDGIWAVEKGAIAYQPVSSFASVYIAAPVQSMTLGRV